MCFPEFWSQATVNQYFSIKSLNQKWGLGNTNLQPVAQKHRCQPGV